MLAQSQAPLSSPACLIDCTLPCVVPSASSRFRSSHSSLFTHPPRYDRPLRMFRLLELDKSSGKVILSTYTGEKIPKYAILSHTWGPDGTEVTYEDVLNCSSMTKPGYVKIEFCAQQATRDGLLYFWIDSCCIDQSKETDLTEAIRSMFKWYEAAAACYVYLSDVPDPKDPSSTVKSSFSNSRWFTRGWTLQELIAPKSVEFFSRQGESLGDRKSREQQINEITGVATEALQGKPLSQFSVEERMQWVAKRETTLEEDAAYCLLGIFGVHMNAKYGEGRQHALDRLHKKIRYFEQQTPLGRDNIPWIVPFKRNPLFTGRGSKLAQLEEKLLDKNVTSKTAVFGLGGIGKTQLVLEYLYRTKEKHRDCSIMWIPATSAESLHQGYLDVVRQLRVPGWEDERSDSKTLLREYLSKSDAGKWLLVFDNADDINMWIAAPALKHDGDRIRQYKARRLVDYLPEHERGRIIFTTRDRKTAVELAQQNIIDLAQMSVDEGKEMLKKCLAKPNIVDNQQDAARLLAELTYLPLAIVQATAYINKNGTRLVDYISFLADTEADAIDLLSEEFEDGRYYDAAKSVATTWLISFQQIRQLHPLAMEYLSFLACVSPKDIPQSLIPPGPSRKKEMDAIGTLDAYSFVSQRPADAALDLHRLVHLATRNWLRKEGLLAQSTEKALTHLEKIFPDSHHKNRSLWRMYLAHARYVLESDQVSNDVGRWLRLMRRYGTCLDSDGRWNEAELAFHRVLEAEKSALGKGHVDPLGATAWLASTFRKQGRWKEAEKLEVQVMETRKRMLGAEHPDTLTSMANLASTYRKQGRWKEAEKLEIQVMETRKRMLGAEHPDTLTSMGNLASTFSDQGRWKEAEELFVQVMETRKRVLGAEHPNTLTSMNNLAFTWKAQGRVAEAVQLMNDCAEYRRRVLGAAHPHFVSSQTALDDWRTEQAGV